MGSENRPEILLINVHVFPRKQDDKETGDEDNGGVLKSQIILKQIKAQSRASLNGLFVSTCVISTSDCSYWLLDDDEEHPLAHLVERQKLY